MFAYLVQIYRVVNHYTNSSNDVTIEDYSPIIVIFSFLISTKGAVSHAYDNCHNDWFVYVWFWGVGWVSVNIAMFDHYSLHVETLLFLIAYSAGRTEK